jgi:hypothetical protein
MDNFPRLIMALREKQQAKHERPEPPQAALP